MTGFVLGRARGTSRATANGSIEIIYVRLAIGVELALIFVLVQQVQSGKGFLFSIARVPETAP